MQNAPTASRSGAAARATSAVTWVLDRMPSRWTPPQRRDQLVLVEGALGGVDLDSRLGQQPRRHRDGCSRAAGPSAGPTQVSSASGVRPPKPHSPARPGRSAWGRFRRPQGQARGAARPDASASSASIGSVVPGSTQASVTLLPYSSDSGWRRSRSCRPGDEVALHHHAADRPLAAGDLPGQVAHDVDLAQVVLLAVAVGGVDHDHLRQAARRRASAWSRRCAPRSSSGRPCRRAG